MHLDDVAFSLEPTEITQIVRLVAIMIIITLKKMYVLSYKVLYVDKKQ